MSRRGELFLPHEAMRYEGFRAMWDMAARRKDEPVGYGMLGMYLFSHAVWLARAMQQGGFDRLVFLARDGRLVRQAYDLVAPVLGVTTASDYVRVSRRAVFPLHFPQKEKLQGLADWVDATAHTPETLTALLGPVLHQADARRAVEAAGLSWSQRLQAADIPRFAAACTSVWNQAGADTYREHARRYAAPHFTGRCATFDVGYNLRAETVLQALTGVELTAFITHTDSDLPHRRGIPFHALYDRSPYVSWVAREQFLLEDAPQCIGYDGSGPVLEADPSCPGEQMQHCQQQALAFVQDMVREYGDALRQMPFRIQDGCAPFEHFLHFGPLRLMKPFRRAGLENAFSAGTNGEDGPFLQWRLMQTDAAQYLLGVAPWRIRLRRMLIRMREDPASAARKICPRMFCGK